MQSVMCGQEHVKRIQLLDCYPFAKKDFDVIKCKTGEPYDFNVIDYDLHT